MAKELEALNIGHLTNLEAGQLVKSNLKDMGSITAGEIVDTVVKNFIISLGNKEVDYDKGLVQVQKNDETDKLIVADNKRDRSIGALNAAIHLGSYSDVETEVLAATSLHTLVSTYTNLQHLNYEAETNGIDNLEIDLANTKYAPFVTLLGIGKYVLRLKTDNEAFKTLYSGRTVGIANTVVYSMKTLRKDLFLVYGNFTSYILTMSENVNTPQYNDVLAVVNAGRKQYADMLAIREGKAAAEKAKEEAAKLVDSKKL